MVKIKAAEVNITSLLVPSISFTSLDLIYQFQEKKKVIKKDCVYVCEFSCSCSMRHNAETDQ